jgi:hypothetical protein
MSASFTGQKFMGLSGMEKLRYQKKIRFPTARSIMSHFVILSEAKDLVEKAGEMLRSTPFRSG